MKAANIKAIIAISEFFTYQVPAAEFAQIIQRASDLEDTTRDREILQSLAKSLQKALAK